jgi:hypothetical protein
MSYTPAHPHRVTRHRPGLSQPRPGGLRRSLLNVALMVILGLAGYGFVTEVAVPSLVDGVVGQSR